MYKNVRFSFFFIDLQQKFRISQVYHYIHWEELTSVSEAPRLYFNFFFENILNFVKRFRLLAHYVRKGSFVFIRVAACVDCLIKHAGVS
jgi:hypothetical protein